MIFEKIRKIISEELDVDPEKITMESSFSEDLNIDSIDLFELVMRVEEEYDIEFTEDDAENLRTVGDVVEFISNK